MIWLKRSVVLLCALSCLLCGGCRWLWPQPDESTPPVSQPNNPSSAGYADSWCYQRLGDRLQAAYAAVYAAVTQKMHTDETVEIKEADTGEMHSYTGLRISLPQPLTSPIEVQQLYTAFTWDHPEFFFIGNTYSYEGYQSGGRNYYNTFCLVFTMNAVERHEASVWLNEKVNALLGAVPENSDAFETELFLHDALLEGCVYDNAAAGDDSPADAYPNAFTAYGALVEGKAVCEGYSRAMQLLMHRSEIPCTLVSGYDRSTQAPHMWNLITIDERNYHLDPTWNDTGDKLRHTFFNLTTSEIQLSHSLDGDNIGVDTCTSVEANYYRRTNSYLAINDPDSLSRLLAERIQDGAESIDLRFTKETYAGALFYFNKPDWLMRTVNRYLGEKMWAYTWEKDDVYNTVTLFKAE